MKIISLAIAAAALGAATYSPDVAANHHHRGQHHSHRGSVWVGPAYYPRYYSPYSYYAAPFVVAPYYVAPPPRLVYVPPPPVVIERRYVEMQPAAPQYRDSERSYAQIAPAPPPKSESRATITPPPQRLERVTLSATELFEFDKAVLRMPQRKLDEIADVLARNPSIDGVQITGYTDRLGSDAYNMKLSQRRAEAVKSYLVQKGVAGGRLTAVGRGESNPVVQCDDKNMAALIKCLEPNRRVEVESITIEVRKRG